MYLSTLQKTGLRNNTVGVICGLLLITLLYHLLPFDVPEKGDVLTRFLIALNASFFVFPLT